MSVITEGVLVSIFFRQEISVAVSAHPKKGSRKNTCADIVVHYSPAIECYYMRGRITEETLLHAREDNRGDAHE